MRTARLVVALFVGFVVAALPTVASPEGWNGQGPTDRGGHGVAWDSARGRLVVFGGFDARGYLVNDTWELNGATWLQKAAAPPAMTPRWRHAMAYDSLRARVVVVGGQGDTPYAAGGTWEYDGTRWTVGPPDPGSSRWDNPMAFDAARGRMVLFTYDRVWEYAGGGWQQGAATPPALTFRTAAAMAYDPARLRVVMFGGRQPWGDPLADTWEYDGAAWTPGPAAPAGLGRRADHAMANLGGGRLLLFGGYDGDQYHADSWIYDGTQWTAGPAAPADLLRRQRLGLVATAPGQVLLHGGEYSRLFFGDLWSCNGTSWSAGASAPPARWNHAMAHDSVRGRTVMFGGEGPSLFGSGYEGPRRNDVWEHDGTRWRPGVPAPAGAARTRHALAYDTVRQRIVVFGGSGAGGNYRNDTWYYDGAAWTPGPSAPPALVPRWSHAMAFDSARGRMVVFGGSSASGLRDDTWELDGTGWLPGPAAPAGLTARAGHSMTFDGRRSRTVLVGGDGGFSLADVWEHTGSAWVAGVAPASGFLPRSEHAAAFDPVRGRVVVFGGLSRTPTDEVVLADTWEYSGSSWDQGLALGPEDPGRMDAAMAFHQGLGQAILFGGRDEDAVFGDTMTYDARDALGYVAGEPLASPSGSRVTGWSSWGLPAATFQAYGAASWGVNVSSGHVAPGTRDPVLTGPGPGPALGPHVRAFVPDGTPVSGVSFYAYGTLRYGVNVGAARLDADAFHEILTGPGPGTPFGPQVRGFNYDGGPLAPIAPVNFFAYGTLRYGVVTAGADVDGDRFGEILTGPGPSPAFSPQVRGFDYDGLSVRAISAINFDAFPTPGYGAQVAGGDVDGDDPAEIVAAHGPGPALPSRYLGFELGGSGITALWGYDTSWSPATGYGARLSLGDIQPDGLSELVGGAGPDPTAPTTVKTWVYDGILTQIWIYFDAFPGRTYGTNVATTYAGY